MKIFFCALVNIEMQKTGHGSTSLYGSGPCLDLNNKSKVNIPSHNNQIFLLTFMFYKEFLFRLAASSGDDDDNILLLGSIDARHILKTSAQQWRHHNKTTDHQDKGRLNVRNSKTLYSYFCSTFIEF